MIQFILNDVNLQGLHSVNIGFIHTVCIQTVKNSNVIVIADSIISFTQNT